jgi:UDP-N-acetylglucosamine 2-epimerase (non-hydrolysing)
LISQLSYLHFAPTALTVENLQRSGVFGEIHQTGNTVIDALLWVAKRQPTCSISGLDWGIPHAVGNGSPARKLGKPLISIAQGFCKY